MRSEHYIEAIDTLRDEGLSTEEIIKSLKRFLTRRKAQHVLPGITVAYNKHALYGYRPEVLKVETAHDTEAGVLESIRKFAGAPEDCRILHKVDPSHIGGFKTLYNHVLIDQTLETSLTKLRSKLLRK